MTYAPHEPENYIRTMIQNNRQAINTSNVNLVRQLSFFMFIILACVALISLFAPGWKEFTALYIASALLNGAFFLLFRFGACKSSNRLLPEIYLYFAVLFMVAIYHGTYKMSQGGSSVTFIAFLLIFPIIMLDKRWHVNLFVAFTGMMFCIVSFLVLPNAPAQDNMTNTVVYGFVGTFIGNKMFQIRLHSMENQRLLVIQRDIDALTLLPNRRKMFEMMDATDGIGSFDSATGIMILDVDYFKRYNDTLGHQEGDECLRRLGACFAAFASDFNLEIFRFGGEEFLTLGNHYGNKTLKQLSEDLVKKVSDLQIPFAASPFGVVTISVGYAETESCKAKGYEELISCADMALYYAKEQGRNIAYCYRSDMKFNT
ncbi:MAG: GGDEF domain-containing protein [Clostridium sp.]